MFVISALSHLMPYIPVTLDSLNRRTFTKSLMDRSATESEPMTNEPDIGRKWNINVTYDAYSIQCVHDPPIH